MKTETLESVALDLRNALAETGLTARDRHEIQKELDNVNFALLAALINERLLGKTTKTLS